MASPQFDLDDHGPEFSPKIDKWGTQAALGRHLFLSTKSVRELIAKGVLDQPEARGLYDLDACRQSYITYLREVSAGRGGTTLTGERARLASEQADGKAMENAVQRGELIERSEVIAIMQEAISGARSRLLGLPSKVAPLVLGVEDLAKINQVVDELVREALDELSTMSIEPTSRDGMVGSDGAVGATAETDGQPMGRQETET